MQPETVSAEYALTPAQMQAFVGRYRLEGKPEVVEVSGGVLNLSLEGGRLVAWDKANRMELRAESAEVLRAREDDTIALRFTRDDQGKVIGFVAHAMGVVEIRGTKLQE